MHHQDFTGDLPGSGSRKTTYHFRRGSSGASASSAAGGAGVAPADDSLNKAGSSSPGLHHQPQSQGSGAQVKKKSGFQITSVTSAQINVSGNNSLADDTESYDDMDESHTEDLSSSDMLDVPMARASDIGVPERSSSDETLNSLHGVDTPGLTSPNEPLHPHSIPQGSQQHASLVNGTVHQHYYPHQHGLPQHRDSLGGGEPSLPGLLIAPLSTSSPAPKPGVNISQRPVLLDSSKPAGAMAHAVVSAAGGPAADAHLQSNVNFLNAPAAVPVPMAETGGGQVGNASSTQMQPPHTQAATGSRFRVVKLDTNSEPFRKGRWTCTEYYEKEVPPATVSEVVKGIDAATEIESASGLSPGMPCVQPPHTLQPYPLPSQDFTSPQAVQSPPQGLPQSATMAYVSHQEGAAHMQKPGVPISLSTAATTEGVIPVLPVMAQQVTHAQASYSAAQLTSGALASIRQPDFIQPTAPFQTQVQPPLPHVPTSVPPSSGVTAQPPASLTQHMTLQSHVAPPAAPIFPAAQPQPLAPIHPQTQPPLTATVAVAQPHGSPFMPLTALHADLQPLLTPGTTLTQASPIKTSQLEDAQKLLFQHQGLLGLPRLGMGTFAEGSSDTSGSAASLAHIGMSAEASAFMVAAAAAGLRTQQVEGEEDSSSGASVVAIDNKIEQAMDLVKSHLMYAVREEVEVLKEQIKELIERNTQLEQENKLLKTLASPEQMAQFQAQVQTGSPTSNAQPPLPAGPTPVLPSTQSSGTSA
ncbi:TSC22 domain family protein 1-like isoform 1-T1 [Synchiropus picturatus]